MRPDEREAWREADRILDGLLDLPPAQREQRLVGMALTNDMCRNVQRLLAAHADTGPLEQPLPLPDETASGTATAEQGLSGRLLGRWRLQHEIGRGGMAVIYRAVAEDGATGQVAALKVLTLASLASQGRERFLQEQQALLRLRHPYIATLYDAGIAGDGTPWLAMALVEGEHIDHWCARHVLDVPARVRLLLQVCEALAYAHRNLVIHRDIKPSNVLVDENGHVRLLDFGIARLADAVDAEATATWLRALTPEYAAPEQFAGAPPSTTMDVYGLGALLYRLLTGIAPRCGSDVTTPITQPSRAAATRGAQAAPAGAPRQLRGDLDTVLLKALAEQPEDRYSSVEALAEDLRRWLLHRPVRAHPPSPGYRLRKYAARHRVGVAVSLMLMLALAAGLSTTLWQARVASEQAARAQAAAEMSKAQLAYLRSVLDVLAPATAVTRELDRHKVIAEAASRALRELSGRPTLLASVELSLGDIARRTGDYRQAHKLFDNALQRRQREFGSNSSEYAEALLHLGTVTDKVDPPDPVLAETRLREAVALLRRHHAEAALLAEALIEHGSQLADLNRYEDARPVLQEAALLCAGPLRAAEICDRVWEALGSLERREGNNVKASDAYEQLLALRRARFGEAHARTAYAYASLGHALLRKGENKTGLRMLEHAYALQLRTNATQDIRSLQTWCDLAEAYLAFNRTKEALELLDEYLARVQALFGEHSTEYAYGLSQVGSLHHHNGRYAEAAEAYGKSHERYVRMLGPRTAMAAHTMGRRADAINQLGRPGEALPLAEQALTVHREVFGERSSRTGERWSHLGNVLLALGRHAEALAAYTRAQAILRRPPMTGMERQRAFAAQSYGSIALLALGQDEKAEQGARAALAEAEAAANRKSVSYGTALANLVTVVCRIGSSAECVSLRQRARTEMREPDLGNGARIKLVRALAQSDGRDRQDDEQAMVRRAVPGLQAR